MGHNISVALLYLLNTAMSSVILDHQTIKTPLRLRKSIASALIYIPPEDLAKWLQKDRRNTRTITSQTTAFYCRLTIFLRAVL